MMKAVVFALLILSLLSPSASARESTQALPTPQPIGPEKQLQQIESTGTIRLSKAAGDTANLYGGPGTQEGKFETSTGMPDWQGWYGVDLTDTREEAKWNVSTFNASTLGNHGAGNHAMWCGQTADQQPSWETPPGYGNNWDSRLIWSSGPLSAPEDSQTVQLDFLFHHDTEPGYDYLTVEYESAGAWVKCMELDGSDKDAGGIFSAPGVAFADVKTQDIVYAGNDYGGEAGDEIRIRIRFTSDGAWSDEDGLWPTDAGAVQVDDISLAWVNGSPQSYFEDFESEGPYAWVQQDGMFAGDFAKLFAGLKDDDPCAGNSSVQVTFIDDGTPPSNGDGQSTGGTTSDTYGYALPGGWVVNHSGGLSNDLLTLDNQIWSPPIAWDLPGNEDDALDSGAELHFDVFNHMRLDLGIFFIWWARASEDDGLTWSGWKNHNFFYHGANDGYYERRNFQIRHLLPANPTHIQIALGIMEQPFYGPSNDATPAPYFDNVRVVRYRAGPWLSTRGDLLFQSCFPQSGEVDPTSDPSALACRLDSGRDLAQNSFLPEAPIIPSDSCVVEAEPLVDGRSITRIELNWLLDVNPYFAAVRSMPPGTVVQPDAGVHGWDRWTGTLAGQPIVPVNVVTENQYSFDFDYEGGAAWPHQTESELAMFFPGDRLRYYIEAEDNVGNISTLPPDISGFTDGHYFDQRFQTHALPSLFDDDGTPGQPSILFVDADERPSLGSFAISSENVPVHTPPTADGLYTHLFGQIGLVEGVDYDRFTLLDPLDDSSGIGSAYAWGATLAQVASYSTILFEGGTGISLLHDGSRSDVKSEDLALLSDWHALEGDRGLALFGDALISFTDQRDGGAFTLFRQDILGLERLTYFLRTYIPDTRVPEAMPQLAGFDTEYAVFMDCREDLDALQPLAGEVAAHGYVIPGSGGSTYSTPVASIAKSSVVGPDYKRAITFPYALSRVYDERSATGDDATRISLLTEVLTYLSPGWSPPNPPIGAELPSRAGIHALQAIPNPFNPKATIRFEVGRTADYSVKIFDLRGRLVRQLHSGTLPAGVQTLIWNGLDDRGSSVASGVYLLQVEGDDQVAGLKLALVR